MNFHEKIKNELDIPCDYTLTWNPFQLGKLNVNNLFVVNIRSIDNDAPKSYENNYKFYNTMGKSSRKTVEALIEHINDRANADVIKEYGKHIHMTITCPKDQEEYDFIKELVEKNKQESSSLNIPYIYTPIHFGKSVEQYKYEVTMRLNPELGIHDEILKIVPEDSRLSNSFHKNKKYIDGLPHYKWPIDFIGYFMNEEDFMPLLFVKEIKISKIRVVYEHKSE